MKKTLVGHEIPDIYKYKKRFKGHIDQQINKNGRSPLINKPHIHKQILDGDK